MICISLRHKHNIPLNFSNKKDKYRIATYNSIMTGLAKCVHKVNIQILENEVSAEYKRIIE